MKAKQSLNQVQSSTYALLVRSQETERSIFETIAYGLTILSAVAAIWQFAAQPVKLPVDALPRTTSVAQAAVVSNS